ncbi:hypothetical protein ACFQ1S_27620, partial [Kibdelosporangium lantanae]
MSVSDLLAALTSGSGISVDLFDDLTAYDLLTLHWDEREQAITTGFDGPLSEALAGTEPDHNRIEFHLRFPNVTDLDIQAWSHEPVDRITGSGTSVAIIGPGTSVRFTSAPATTVNCRTY